MDTKPLEIKSGFGTHLTLLVCLGGTALLPLLQCQALDFPDALVGHWKFDEQSGQQVKDSSTNHLDGTLYGGQWTIADNPFDGAVDFSGPGQALFIPADGLPAPDKIANLDSGSIVLRFRFAGPPPGTIYPILTMGQRTADRPEQYTLIVEVGHGNDDLNRKIYFTIISAGMCFDTGVDLLPDTWYHYVVTVGPSGNTGYLNGEELVGRHYNLGSTPAYTNFFSSVPSRECLTLNCGRYAGNFGYSQSAVSDLQIYNRPLTADEVKRLYLDTIDANLFTIQGPRRTEDGFALALSWASDSNYRYSVLEKDELSGTDWQPVDGLEQLPPTSPTNTVYLPVQGNALSLFRVMASPNGQ